MLNRLLRPAHEQTDPARRVAAVADLPPEGDDLARLVSEDPAPEVRRTAAARCSRLATLAAALKVEADAGVRDAVAAGLGAALASTPDDAAARTLLASDDVTDAIRVHVALHATDAARSVTAIAHLGDEAARVEVALRAERAQTRMAAAEGVTGESALQRLAEGAQDRDRGVARLARQRLQALVARREAAVQADAILAQAEALVDTPGPVVTAAVELDHRWQALALGDDAARVARWDAATLALKARFDREHDAQRQRARLERARDDALTAAATLDATSADQALADARGALTALRERLAGAASLDGAALAEAEHALLHVAMLEEQRVRLGQARAAAEALVREAEEGAARVARARGPRAGEAAADPRGSGSGVPAGAATAPGNDVATAAVQERGPGTASREDPAVESAVPGTPAPQADSIAAGPDSANSPDAGRAASTEASPEAATEASTAVATEAATEAAIPATTEAVAEAATEAVAEAVTEATTEAVTEAVTEAATEGSRDIEAAVALPESTGTVAVTGAATGPSKRGRAIDPAALTSRWAAIDPAARPADLSARFEAALRSIQHQRQAVSEAVQQQHGAARLRIHDLLNAAEQALAAGQLHVTRTHVDAIKQLKPAAGPLPRPTQQRLGRLGQQLGDLERWESFGQQSARISLCERAEALAADVARQAAASAPGPATAPAAQPAAAAANAGQAAESPRSRRSGRRSGSALPSDTATPSPSDPQAAIASGTPAGSAVDAPATPLLRSPQDVLAESPDATLDKLPTDRLADAPTAALEGLPDPSLAEPHAVAFDKLTDASLASAPALAPVEPPETALSDAPAAARPEPPESASAGTAEQVPPDLPEAAPDGTVMAGPTDLPEAALEGTTESGPTDPRGAAADGAPGEPLADAAAPPPVESDGPQLVPPPGRQAKRPATPATAQARPPRIAAPRDPAKLAQEVQALRNAWKKLDQQHAGVPKPLWERFDRACEKAYAPAARYFAEQAGQRKEARGRRTAFIEQAAAHAPTLLAEPRDWRAIERWMRETENTWRTGDLGSVAPAEWHKLDARLKDALVPLRKALLEVRGQAVAAREALIQEATALVPRAHERDAVTQVRAIQARWQEQARAQPVSPRDERTLWNTFRAACDAVFTARDERRREDDGRRHESRRALDGTLAQIDQLAATANGSEQEVRHALRDLQQRFGRKPGGEPPDREVDARARDARKALEAALAARSRAGEQAVWSVVADKARLCEALDRAVLDEAPVDAALRASTLDAWGVLAALPPAWEKRLLARRDAALLASENEDAGADHRDAIAARATSRIEALLELEMRLGLASPPELQAQRLAVQVRQLRNRFKDPGNAAGDALGELLLAWHAEPGVASPAEWTRSAAIRAALARSGGPR